MAPTRRPIFHMVAGPNGAGKTTFYRNELKAQHPGLPFVNADEMALQRFGHAAETEAEAKEGQRLAEDLRRELMAAKQDFVSESTFSHPSKNLLLDEARTLGYRVHLYHVNVRDADTAVARVATRVEAGGHPVPEDRIRGRYERNQALIREAVLAADRAFVFDNSHPDMHQRMAMIFRSGRVETIGANVPLWARDLYSAELQSYSPQQLNAAAHSFAQARAFTQVTLGDDAHTYAAKGGGDYKGLILASTSLHVLQQVAAHTVVAHFTNRLSQVRTGEHCRIRYEVDGSSASVTPMPRAASRGTTEDQARGNAFRRLPRDEALKQYPELVNVYAHLSAFQVAMKERGHVATPEQIRAVQERMGRELAGGKQFGDVAVRAPTVSGKGSRDIGRVR